MCILIGLSVLWLEIEKYTEESKLFLFVFQTNLGYLFIPQFLDLAIPLLYLQKFLVYHNNPPKAKLLDLGPKPFVEFTIPFGISLVLSLFSLQSSQLLIYTVLYLIKENQKPGFSPE